MDLWKEVFTTYNYQEFSRMEDALTEHGIPYRCKYEDCSAVSHKSFFGSRTSFIMRNLPDKILYKISVKESDMNFVASLAPSLRFIS